MIQPTIGRVVWFRYNKEQEVPHPALVCAVHNEREINVGGFTADGTHFQQSNVRLVQEGDAIPEAGVYAEWMPYQQAATKAAGDVGTTSRL